MNLKQRFPLMCFKWVNVFCCRTRCCCLCTTSYRCCSRVYRRRACRSFSQRRRSWNDFERRTTFSDRRSSNNDNKLLLPLRRHLVKSETYSFLECRSKTITINYLFVNIIENLSSNYYYYFFFFPCRKECGYLVFINGLLDFALLPFYCLSTFNNIQL